MRQEETTAFLLLLHLPNKTYRLKHSTGWSIGSSNDFSRYRLALYSTTLTDSGRYTCHTPNGQNNKVEVIVKGTKLI